MQDIMTPDNIVFEPIQNGDAGMIFRANGQVQVFNCFDLQSGTVTNTQQATHEKLKALFTALHVPEIMDVLLTMANDPAIVGEPGIAATRQ